MAINATALQFLDTLAAYELLELGSNGGLIDLTYPPIKATWGHKMPTAIAGQYPCILGWVTSWQWKPEDMRGQGRTQEYGGASGTDQPGAMWGIYRVKRYIVVGPQTEALEVSLDHAMYWIERYRDAVLKHNGLKVNGAATVLKVSPLGGSVQTLPIGGQWQRAICNELEVLTISSPVILP